MSSKEVINYMVNDLHQETSEKKLLVSAILANAGYDPLNYVLVRSKNTNHILPADKEENIQEGEEFLAISKNPTPVSE